MLQRDSVTEPRKVPIVRNIASNKNRFKVIGAYPDGKPWWAVLWDLNVLVPRSGLSKYEYMEFGLFRKSSGEFSDFCTVDNWKAAIERTELPDVSFALQNKLVFSNAALDAGLILPKLLGHCTPDTFTVHASGEERVFDRRNASKALEALLEQSDGRFFAKTIDGSMGEGAFRGHQAMTVSEFLNDLGAKTMIFEECVDQHPEIAAFNPDALNTLRIVTVRRSNGPAEIATAYIRIGRKGSPVDNMATGGVAFAVDKQTGILADEGCIYTKFGGGASPFHPDTGKRIGGSQLPFFSEIRSLAVQAAKVFPNMVIGWDIGVTPYGPVLIEGNRHPDLRPDQMVNGPYYRHSVINKLLTDLGFGETQ